MPSERRASDATASDPVHSPIEKSSIGYLEAIGLALDDIMAADDRTFVLGQDVGRFAIGGMTRGLLDKYGPARIRDCPISESAMVGIGVGAAMNGYTVVVEMAYADIAAVAFSSIVHSAAKLHYASNGRLRCPLIVRSPINRFSRHGPMGTEVTISWFFNVPDLDIVMPATPDEAYWLFRHAATRPVPTLFVDDRSLGMTIGEIGPELPDSQRARWLRTGGDLTIVAAGRMAVVARDAADALADGSGIDAGVISLGCVRPLDRETVLAAATATGRVLIVQEEPPFGGYGPAIQSALATLPLSAFKCQPVLLARADVFLPYRLEEDILPSKDAIIEAACATVKRNG